jgi:hypothetical protein
VYAELKMDTSESYCVLEIVFSNNAVCPGVKDGHFGELLRPGGRIFNQKPFGLRTGIVSLRLYFQTF